MAVGTLKVRCGTFQRAASLNTFSEALQRTLCISRAFPSPWIHWRTIAYLIFTREKTTNPAEMEVYAAKSKATLGTFGMKPLVAYGTHEVLEGDSTERVIALEFPTAADARAWYDSPAYQDAMAHRHRGAEYRAILVEGLPQ